MKNKERISHKIVPQSRQDKILHWVVMQGGPISACTQTRQQARKAMKKLRELPIQNGAFLFIGKCFNPDGKHATLIFDT